MRSVMPRFLIAKYVPDLSRNEPKNIGVFCWVKGAIEAKFLEVESAGFVQDKENFVRWQKFWLKRIEGDAVRPIRGAPVSKADPACMDALRETQEGQYQLRDCGEILKQVGKRGLKEATEFLFRELVVPVARKGQDAKPFQSRCDQFLKEVGIADLPEFANQYGLECQVFDQSRRLVFDYGIGNGNGRTRAVIQRVPLGNEMRTGLSVAMLNEAANTIKAPQRCAAIVKLPPNPSDRILEDYAFLDRVCTVIDIDKPETVNRFVRIASARA